MKYIIGENRNQVSVFPVSLEETIDKNHEVRIIDLFVDSLELPELGFRFDFVENGRPAYHPKDLLKLFIYGYLNRTRSSRELEKECKRNIEVMWLLKGLTPDHNTISNFRRDHPKAIKNVFRATVSIAKNLNLIGGKLLAGDSTKLRAQNSKKNNYNEKKIERHLAYIDSKLAAYEEQLAEADGDNKALIQQELEKHKDRKQFYHDIKQELKESGEAQISQSDPESRQMITRNNITEVAYNIQTTVDSANMLPIDYKVTNQNDSKAMGDMLLRCTSILGHNKFTCLYDKGYHTGSEFQTAHDLGINVLVAIPRVAANAPDPTYNVEYFHYDKNRDCYICPQDHEMHNTGKWHQAKTYKFKRYTTRQCLSCGVKDKCSKAKYGKAIQRSEYQEYIDTNKRNIEKNHNYYRRRQAIVEHPYGTIKRQWGFSYIMTKQTMLRASADVGLVFVAYNLRRIMNIVDIEVLMEHINAIYSKIAPLLAIIDEFLRDLIFLFTNKYKQTSALRTHIFAKFKPDFVPI